MPISILDLVVLGVVVISALLAAVRGFTREVLAIVAWVTAAAAAWFLHPAVLPLAKQYINNNTVALVAAIGGIFIVTLIIVSIITVKVSDLILDSRIGALDRTLGFMFGAARGFLICVIGWVFLNWLLQGKNPEWADRGPHASGPREHRQQPHRHAPGQSGGAAAATAQPAARRTASRRSRPSPIRSARAAAAPAAAAAQLILAQRAEQQESLAIAPSPPT